MLKNSPTRMRVGPLGILPIARLLIVTGGSRLAGWNQGGAEVPSMMVHTLSLTVKPEQWQKGGARRANARPAPEVTLRSA